MLLSREDNSPDLCIHEMTTSICADSSDILDVNVPVGKSSPNNYINNNIELNITVDGESLSLWTYYIKSFFDL